MHQRAAIFARWHSRGPPNQLSRGHCKASVEKAVAGVDPLAKVAVDLTTRHADIVSASTPAALIAALKLAGYEGTAQ